MSGFLDTSIIVRYLTGDPPDLASQAAEIIDRDENLKVTDVVLVETAHVLTSVYEIDRKVVVDNLITFMQKKNISPFAMEKSLILQALLLCRPSGRISFADAMVWAAVRSAEDKVIYSLDDRFPSNGVEVRKQFWIFPYQKF